MNDPEAGMGYRYSMWTLTDLREVSINVLLFREAHASHWKDPIGSVMVLLNPQVLSLSRRGFCLHLPTVVSTFLAAGFPCGETGASSHRKNWPPTHGRQAKPTHPFGPCGRLETVSCTVAQRNTRCWKRHHVQPCHSQEQKHVRQLPSR